jgi:hypothetical protein
VPFFPANDAYTIYNFNIIVAARALAEVDTYLKINSSENHHISTILLPGIPVDKLLSKESWIDGRPVALLPPMSSSNGSTAKRTADEGRLTYAGRGASPEIALIIRKLSFTR